MENENIDILKQLEEKGRRKGSLTGEEITNALESVDLDMDQIDKIYESLENLGISIINADEEEAKDIVQETFLRVWLNISKYDSRRNFTTWLYAIASRLCLDHLRSRTHVVAMPEDESVLQRFADNDSQRTLENSEWAAVVRTLADGLSPKQKLVFTLCQLEGLPSAEVELITGLDAKQVKSNLYVARQTIRKRLNELGYE